MNTGSTGALAAHSFAAFQPLPYVSGQSRSLDAVNGNLTIEGELESATTESIAVFQPLANGFEENFVAETGSAAPGLNGVTFEGFDEPAVNANGDVAFYAKLSGTGINTANAAGIFVIT